MLFFCNIASVAQRTFEIVQKSRSRGHDIDKNVCRLCMCASPDTSAREVPRDISRRLQLTSCAIMAS